MKFEGMRDPFYHTRVSFATLKIHNQDHKHCDCMTNRCQACGRYRRFGAKWDRSSCEPDIQ